MAQPRSDLAANTHSSRYSRQRRVIVKIADTREREIALQRRAEIYTRELGHHGLDEYDKTAIHLVALDEEESVVGAVRLIGPKPLPLEIEEFVPLEADTSRVLQVGGFWVEPKERRAGPDWVVPFALRDAMMSVTLALGAARVILRTYHHLLRYYSSIGFVHVKGKDYQDPAWGNVVTMILDARSTWSTGPAARYRRRVPFSRAVAGGVFCGR